MLDQTVDSSALAASPPRLDATALPSETETGVADDVRTGESS
jgi:hypothetical protein